MTTPMPSYISAEVLLAEARLRLDALGSGSGIIVVEGPDDKRLFYSRTVSPAQIMPTGGRTLLLAAFRAAKDADRERMIFVTDCDYAVRAGELSGGHGLVITAGTDVESDLLSLGLLSRIVTEIVPSALPTNQVDRIAAQALQLATTLALPLGRVRMAARPLGVDLELEELDFSKYWIRRAGQFDETKLLRVTGDKLRAAGHKNLDWIDRVRSTPSDSGMCHGKDLISAIRTVLIKDHGVDQKVSTDVLSVMLRLVVDDSRFEEWPVVKRIRKWEAATGSSVLRNGHIVP